MARPRHHIIYVPGLGDGFDPGRRAALRAWRVWGVTTELVPMQWFDGNPYAEKERRVLDAVRRAEAEGAVVSLIGESAGGSMAINVAAQLPRPHALITVCGANDPAAPVAPETLAKSPAFDESLRRLRGSLPLLARPATQVVRAWYDPIVKPQHTRIEGVRTHRLPTVGHMTTITLCLTVLSGYVVILIKRTRSRIIGL